MEVDKLSISCHLPPMASASGHHRAIDRDLAVTAFTRLALLGDKRIKGAQAAADLFDDLRERLGV